MADLVTHLCAVLLPGALLPVRGLVLVAVGAVLPDLAARVPPILLEQLGRFIHVPDTWISCWTVLHEPLPLVALCGLAATTFVPEQRWRALSLLLVGAATHIGLDVLQDHHGCGYALAFPLSSQVFELGWMGSQATVEWAPWLALITAVAWGLRVKRTRARV